jgi:enolase
LKSNASDRNNFEAVDAVTTRAATFSGPDPAASEFYDGQSYVFKSDGRSPERRDDRLWKDWVDKYPIVSLRRHGRK